VKRQPPDGVLSAEAFRRHTLEDVLPHWCEHALDRECGGWFGELTRENAPSSDAKGGPWRADYHVVQMCAELWRFLSGSEGGAR